MKNVFASIWPLALIWADILALLNTVLRAETQGLHLVCPVNPARGKWICPYSTSCMAGCGLILEKYRR